MTATIPNRPSEVAELAYQVTGTDRALIGHAIDRFAQDYRYLLDMVTTAGKADRATRRPAESGPDHAQFSDDAC